MSSAQQINGRDGETATFFKRSFFNAELREFGFAYVISSVGRTSKKGSDKDIDGIKVFVDDNSGKAKRVIVQVKGRPRQLHSRRLVNSRR